MLNFGDCCVFVEGKVDPIKAGIAKYNNLKHKSPEVIERMNQESQRKNAQRQSMLGDSAFTGNLIDNWARSKQKNKIITGK
jgi:hemoglobin-like flavoprotein